MSERNPALTSILAMEDHIATVARIGQLLLYLGERDGEITADALTVPARLLLDHSHDLKLHFAAFRGCARRCQGSAVMSGRTSRRAALGAILAAPLASVPAVAAPAALPDYEVRLIALGPQLIALCDELDRLWPASHETYAAWSKASQKFPTPCWEKAELLPEWQDYLDTREPLDAVDDQIDQLVGSFIREPMQSLPGITLRLRYAASYEGEEAGALADLCEYLRRHPPCA